MRDAWPGFRHGADTAAVDSEASSKRGSARDLALFAAVAAALTVATIGFKFGVSNNVYHIPYVLRYDTLPQFAGDEYYQSLRSYSSIVWLTFRQIATEQNIYWLFYTAYWMSLWGYFLALLRAVSRLAPVGWFQLLLASLLFATSYLDTGYSTLGDHDLVPGYFSHTMLATPIVLFALSLGLRQRLVWALALLGLAFDVNAFVAVWAAVALLGISIWLWREGVSQRQLLGNWLLGSLSAAVVASPVLLWIIRDVTNNGGFQGDFVGFLRLMFPNHFLIDSVSLHQIIVLVSTIVMGLSALALLDREGRGWRAAFLGFLGVFVVGCLIPYVTHSRLLLDLHLLRVDGFLQIIATMGAVAVILRDLQADGSPARAVFAISVTVCLILSRYLLPVAALLMLLRVLAYRVRVAHLLAPVTRLVRKLPIGTALASGIVFGLVGLVWLSHLIRPADLLEPEPQRNSDFAALTQWSRQTTDPHAVFLLNGQWFSIFDKFEMWSQRRVWFDIRQGMSVLWNPHFYQTWRARYDALQSLHTPTERLAYACHEKLDYYIDERVNGFDLQQRDIAPFIVFRNPRFFAIDTRRYCHQ